MLCRAARLGLSRRQRRAVRHRAPNRPRRTPARVGRPPRRDRSGWEPSVRRSSSMSNPISAAARSTSSFRVAPGGQSGLPAALKNTFDTSEPFPGAVPLVCRKMPPLRRARCVSPTARRHSGMRWSTCAAITASSDSLPNGSTVASPITSGMPEPAALSRSRWSIGADRSSPTTGTPLCQSGRAILPVPTPISSTRLRPASASASISVWRAANSGGRARVRS